MIMVSLPPKTVVLEGGLTGILHARLYTIYNPGKPWYYICNNQSHAVILRRMETHLLILLQIKAK